MAEGIRFEFVPFSRELEEPFERLFAQEGFDRPSESLNWAYCSPGRQGWAAIARDKHQDSKIVGVMAIVPMTLSTAEGPVQSYQAVDLVVDPAYRGRGLFSGMARKLLDGAAELGGALVWGFPNESAAHAWFNRFGWIRLGLAPFMVRPLRSGFALRHLAPALGRLDVPLIRVRRGKPRGRVVERFGSEADRLWKRVAPQLGCAVERDSSWLNWRLFDRPHACYRTVGAYDADDEMTAFVSSTIAPRYGSKALFMLEALGRDDHAPLSSLIREELAQGAADGAEIALCWCPPGAPGRKAYRKAGFLPLPARLRPTQTYHGVKPLQPLPDQLVSSSGWYVSFLDFDAI